MATIKDVAKHAGVSIGTVSNVLNGKTKNEDLIHRVQTAVKELSYRPDMNAQSLKSAKSGLIGVLLPDSSREEYSSFLYYAEEFFREKGYDLLIKYSRNNRVLGARALEAFIKRNVDCAIVYSLPDSSMIKNCAIPVVYIGTSRKIGGKDAQILLNYQNALRKALADLRSSGAKKIGVIFTQELIESKMLSEILEQSFPEQNQVQITLNSDESGFQAGFTMLHHHPEIDAVIAGSYAIAMGVEKVKTILGRDALKIVAVKENSWFTDENHFYGQISIETRMLARQATDCVTEILQNTSLREFRQIALEAVYTRNVTDSVSKLQEQKSVSLRFAMLDCPTARSLQEYSCVFEKKTHVHVEFEMFSYREMEHLLFEQAEHKSSYYDGFMIDLPWFDVLIETGYVKNLDFLMKKNPRFFEGFVLDTMKNYGMYVESYYGIPFVSGAQLLFYQKDIFEDSQLKMQFRRKYSIELEPPKTWAEFLLVAEFFTRSYNEYSPVKYGLSQIRGVNIYTSLLFMNYLWAYGGDLFDKQGNVALHGESALTALKNLVKSYDYTSGVELGSWNEANKEFRSGDSAMIVLYDSDMGELDNYMESKVAGNVGYTQIPGKTPVLGGWCLSLNTYGEHIDMAIDFLTWAVNRKNATPISILGGSTLREERYRNLQAAKWKEAVYESLAVSRKREFPASLDGDVNRNQIYQTIIPEEIEKVLNKKLSAEEALQQMESRIQEFLKEM